MDVNDIKAFEDCIYIGDLQDGCPHGKGKCLYADGSLYDGEFVNGQSEGKGSATFFNHDKYEGEWKNGKVKGKSKVTYSDGRVEYVDLSEHAL